MPIDVIATLPMTASGHLGNPGQANAERHSPLVGTFDQLAVGRNTGIFRCFTDICWLFDSPWSI